MSLGVVSAALQSRGAQVTTFDGTELSLGFPGEPETEDAKRLKAEIAASDAIVFATPEYHGSYSAYAKLIIENLGYPSVLKGKPTALLGVASGRIGAVKTLEQLRTTCAHEGAIVLPLAVSIAGVRRVFNEEGVCTDENVEKAFHMLADNLMAFLNDYVRPRQILEEMIRAGQEVPWTASS